MSQSEHIQDVKLAISEALVSVKGAISILSRTHELHAGNLDDETRGILDDISKDLEGGLNLADTYLTGKHLETAHA